MEFLGILLLNNNRVSCVECVDDTDVAQFLISKKALVNILTNLGEISDSSKSMDWVDQLNFEKVWIKNADALSKIYTGTISQNRSLELGFFPSYSKHIHIKISRAYLNCFVDQSRQDKLNIFMNQLTDGNNGVSLVSPIANDLHSIRIRIRQAINRRELSNSFNLSSYFFFQTWILPQKIESTAHFLAAIFWLSIYLLYRLFGFHSNDLVRKTMSFHKAN
jgi:hypothetical protein